MLILDDDRDVCMAHASYFQEMEGISAVATGTIREARRALNELLKKHERLIAVVDYHLMGDPDGTSLDFIKYLRRYFSRESLIYVCTGDNQENTEKEVADAGANRFFVKPLRYGCLLAWAQVDLTEREMNEEERATDEMTGLWRLPRFEKETLALCKEMSDESELAFFSIDVDHFKDVNDQYGHFTGDKVLQATAQVLRMWARATDSISRSGGDEFVALLPGITKKMARQKGEELKELISRTKVFGPSGERVPFSISVGVVHITGKKLRATPDPVKFLRDSSELDEDGMYTRRRRERREGADRRIHKRRSS